MPQRAHSGPILSNKPDICVSGPKSDCCFLTRAEAFVVLAILASLRSSSLAEMATKGWFLDELTSEFSSCYNKNHKKRERKKKAL